MSDATMLGTETFQNSAHYDHFRDPEEGTSCRDCAALGCISKLLALRRNGGGKSRAAKAALRNNNIKRRTGEQRNNNPPFGINNRAGRK